MNPSENNSVVNLYLFDMDSPSVRRDWNALLPAGYKPVVVRDRAFQLEVGTDDVACGVVVTHASSFVGLGSREREGVTAHLAPRNLYLVIVSGGEANIDDWVRDIGGSLDEEGRGNLRQVFTKAFHVRLPILRAQGVF